MITADYTAKNDKQMSGNCKRLSLISYYINSDNDKYATLFIIWYYDGIVLDRQWGVQCLMHTE